MAQDLETSPEGVINALQRARELDRISRENIAYRQQVQELQAQAAEYQQRMGGGQAPQPRYTPDPQPYRAPQPQGDDDPIALLRAVQEETRELRRQQSEWMEAARQDAEARQTMQEQAYVREQGQQLTAQMERYLHDKNQGRREPINLDDFAEEVALSGGMNPHVPLEQAMERALLWMTRDEQFQAARNETLEKLQNKRAVVTIPGARGGTSVPAPVQPSDNGLGNLTLGDAREFFPNTR